MSTGETGDVGYGDGRDGDGRDGDGLSRVRADLRRVVGQPTAVGHPGAAHDPAHDPAHDGRPGRVGHARRAEGGGQTPQPGRDGQPGREGQPGQTGRAQPREAAVLVLFGVLDDVLAARGADDARSVVPADLDVLLVERAASLRAHPGQVAFPGGRLDPEDDGVVTAALREATEETGLDTRAVEVLGTLPPLPLVVSDHLVTPVLAWWTSPGPVRVVDTAECAAVFRAPVADLLDPANRRTAVLHRGGATRHRGPAFVLGGTLVWGFTAHVLDTLFTQLGWAEPWDTARTVDIRA